ncbi:MAG: ABC transporter ATP-binding protein [Acidimicrobiales bacterium]
MSAGDSRQAGPLLDVRELRAEFRTRAGVVRAVDGVSFSVQPGQVLAVLGESGCGKTATALAILGLLPSPAGRVVGGQVLFKGEDLLTARPGRIRQIRGNRIAMVFQEPVLNPVSRVGDQVSEVIRAHRNVPSKEATERAVALLDLVGIPQARDRSRDYPHQFSGGMRQRAMIAMAIALDPELLIADEPTTALDVTVQAQVLELLLGVRERLGMAMILITHDLGVVAGVAERVMVMYAGRNVEEADLADLYRDPRHPYTAGLLASTIRLDRPRRGAMAQIAGTPPNLIEEPAGCRFAPRCPHADQRCREDYPVPVAVGVGHHSACHYAARWAEGDVWPRS